MSRPSPDSAAWAYYLRTGGFDTRGVVPEPDPVSMMENSIEGSPVAVIGRLYHSVHVAGLSTGQGVTIDATNFDLALNRWGPIGSEITADGVVQLPTGAYRDVKAALTTPGGNQLNGALVGGETVVTVDSTADFPASGKARIGSDVFSYTGKTGTTFTGVPATGDLAVGAHADNAPVIAANISVALASFR